MARSMDPNDDPKLTRALRAAREEQRTRQQATAINTDPNDDPKLARALRPSMEEQRTRQQAEGREEQDTTIGPKTQDGSALGETNKEAPPQRAPAPDTARSIGNKGQMDTTRPSGKTPGQGGDQATTTEEEQVARAIQRSMVKAGASTMQRSMAKAGRDEAPAKEIEKDGGDPMEAHKESDNVPSTHADQENVLNKDPCTEGKERGSEGAQEEAQYPSRALPNEEASPQRALARGTARS